MKDYKLTMKEFLLKIVFLILKQTIKQARFKIIKFNFIKKMKKIKFIEIK